MCGRGWRSSFLLAGHARQMIMYYSPWGVWECIVVVQWRMQWNEVEMTWQGLNLDNLLESESEDTA